MDYFGGFGGYSWYKGVAEVQGEYLVREQGRWGVRHILFLLVCVVCIGVDYL